MWSEIPWYKLTETYLKVWDYKIWKQKWFYNICHNNNWCLNWEILGIKNNTYFFIKLNNWKWYIGEEEFFGYKLFKKDNRIVVYNLNDLPKFWILNWNNLEFYSQNDLKNLSKEKQNIFKELEKNPKIIINWTDYTGN